MKMEIFFVHLKYKTRFLFRFVNVVFYSSVIQSIDNNLLVFSRRILNNFNLNEFQIITIIYHIIIMYL